MRRNIAQTFVFFDDGELIGYVAVCTDALRLSEPEKKDESKDSIRVKDFPAFKIARFAVHKKYNHESPERRRYGERILHLMLNHLREVSKQIGARFVTVDAYPKAVGFYERYSFVKNQDKKYRKGQDVSMRLDLHTPDDN